MTKSTTPPTETDVLTEIGVSAQDIQAIINGQKKLPLFIQSSHLDYDWLGVFWQHWYGYSEPASQLTPVQSIIAQVAKLTNDTTAKYCFSMAEMRFLQIMVEHNPDIYTQLRSAAQAHTFSIIGGGLITPDSAVSPGGAFIRCYHLSNNWVSKTFPEAQSFHCWIIDNFGHADCLPIVVEAMGMTSISLPRIPGSLHQDNGYLANFLFQNKDADFIWAAAADGSQIIVHWMQDSYSQSPHNHPYTTGRQDNPADVGQDIQEALCGVSWDSWAGNIATVRTPYILWPSTEMNSDSSVAHSRQDDRPLARHRHARLAQFLRPVLARLAQHLDIRLVQTALDLVQVILTHRHRAMGLLLSELGGELLGPDQAPAGTKRISNLRIPTTSRLTASTPSCGSRPLSACRCFRTLVTRC